MTTPPITPMPDSNGNPLVAQFHALPDPLKQALIGAHLQGVQQATQPPAPLQIQPLNNGPQTIHMPTSQPAGAPPDAPQGVRGISGLSSPAMPPMGAAPDVMAPRGTTAGDQSHLTQQINQGSGLDQIHSPWARVPLQILQGIVGATGIGHAIESGIPGTDPYHQRQVQSSQAQVQNDIKGDTARSQQQAQGARTAEEEAQTQEIAPNAESERQYRTAQTEAIPEKNEIAQNKADDTLRKAGYRRDENGNTVPLAYGELSPQQQGMMDVQKAHQEELEATAEYHKYQANPNSPQAQAAIQRAQNARTNQALGWAKVQQARDSFNLRSQGVLPNGTIPEGAMLSDEGKPVGTAFQQNVRPTGAQRTKGTLAESAGREINTMMDIAQKHPEKFGPGYSQTEDFKKWLGSQDPDAQRFRTAHAIAGEHAAAMFGSHSAETIKQVDDALGSFHDNPASARAAMQEVLGATGVFSKAGNVRTQGSSGAGGGTQKFTVNGEQYEVPANRVDAFKKRFPDAK